MGSWNLGILRIVDRSPTVRWAGSQGLVVISTETLGFAGAAQEDRLRWLAAFRRLLDGLDLPVQFFIDAIPGTESEAPETFPIPADRGEMRGADLCFVDGVAACRSARRVETSFVTSEGQAPSLEAALREMGVSPRVSSMADRPAVGTEALNLHRHVGGFSRTWYMDRLPGIQLEAGWLFDLLPPRFKVRLACHIHPLASAWIAGYLQRQLTNMRASRLQEQSMGSADPALAGALPNAEDLQRRLVSSQDKAFHVSVYLTLTSPTRNDLDEGSTRVEAAARAVLCSLRPCTLRMFDGFVATQAGGPDRLQRRRVLDSSTLTTFFPWHDADLHQVGGLAVGRNGATGSPVLIDPFDQRRFANANIGVFGYSGTGKTYLLSAIAMGAIGLGAQVYVIDPEHEYGALARMLGGVDVQLALGSGHALNVLDLRPADGRNEAWLGPAAADAVDLCACICGELDETERAIVESAVRAAYSEVAEPVLRDVALRVRRDSRIASILNRWVQGSLGQMFSAPTNVDLEAPIVSFGMRELREEMVAPVHFLLAQALWTRIKRRDRRRMLVVDELGMLFEDPTIRRFVVSLARRIRKYEGSLVFATQNPGDLLGSDQGTVVATNPAVLFMGAQRPGEAIRLQSAFHLSAEQRTLLETARRGEFLLAAGSDRLAVHVQAPPWQEEAMRLGRPAARPPPGG